MFQFALERGLLRFKLKTPALAPLFQLPPQIGKRSIPYPTCLHSLSSLLPFCQFQLPDRTIVHIFSEVKNLSYMTIGHMPLTFPLLHLIPVVWFSYNTFLLASIILSNITSMHLFISTTRANFSPFGYCANAG